MKSKRSWLASPYVIWMALFTVIPIIMMVVYAFTQEIVVDAETGEKAVRFTLDNFAQMGSYTVVFLRSFKLALVSTAVCLLIGYPVAYLMAKEGPRFQKIAMALIMLPMWMNFLLRTYAWMSILENTGLLNRLFKAIGLIDLVNRIMGTNLQFFPMINTQGAVVLGMVYNYLPFMILPLSLPGVLSGITMVFVPAVSTFAISRLLGGNNLMLLGNLIEMQFVGTAYNPHLGSAISLVMMVVVVICMAVMNRFGEGEEQAVIL